MECVCGGEWIKMPQGYFLCKKNKEHLWKVIRGEEE